MATNKLSNHSVLFVLVLTLLVGLPFLNKPFHIDDTVYLAVSDQILIDPLRPFSGEINWRNDPVSMFDIDSSPPLLSYFLAPVIAVFGHSEVALHAAMMLFLLILAWSLLKLSHRFTCGSWWPVLFVMLSPAIIVSGNVMKDVPMVALATASIAVFIQGCDEDRAHLLVIGSLLAGLAMLTKYSAIIVLPLLVFYAVSRGKIKSTFYLLYGIALVGLWFVQNIMVHGTTHVQRLSGLMTVGADWPWQGHVFSGFVILGASCFLLPGLVLMLIRPFRPLMLGGFVLFWAMSLLGLKAFSNQEVNWLYLLEQLSADGLDWQYYLWFLFGSGLVWFVLSGAFTDRFGSRAVELKTHGFKSWRGSLSEESLDYWFLMVWFLLIVYFSVFQVFFQAVRHLMPALVPLVLLAIIRLQRIEGFDRVYVRTVLASVLVLQGVISMWVGAADYAQADTYRRQVKQVEAEFRAIPQGVWFSGHWGWQHYASMAGWSQLSTNGPQPKAGEIVVFPGLGDYGQRPKGFACEYLSTNSYPNQLGMVTVNTRGVNFYAVVGGAVPFLFSQQEDLEQFTICRVTSDRS